MCFLPFSSDSNICKSSLFVLGFRVWANTRLLGKILEQEQKITRLYVQGQILSHNAYRYNIASSKLKKNCLQHQAIGCLLAQLKFFHSMLH